MRDSRAVWADIQSGKAVRVPTPPGREVTHLGVWHGCKFVYLKSRISTYQLPEGGVAEVSEQPEPLPPKDPGCVDREPTRDEINASRVHATALNDRGRPAGAPPPPTVPTD